MLMHRTVMDTDGYLTIKEAAEFLGVSPWTLRNWDRDGRLKPLRHPLNGYRLYRRDQREGLLKRIARGRACSPRAVEATVTPSFQRSTRG